MEQSTGFNRIERQELLQYGVAYFVAIPHISQGQLFIGRQPCILILTDSLLHFEERLLRQEADHGQSEVNLSQLAAVK